MGLGDLFRKIQVCPECRTRGAERAFPNRIRCRTTACRHYDPAMLERPLDPSLRQAPPSRKHQGNFDPGPNRVVIQYRNFRGEDVEFVGDRTTIRFTKGAVSIRVAPTGRRIALLRKFTRNLEELEQAGEAALSKLTPVERQIAGYHRKRGTTSPRYEELLREHPELRSG